MRFLITAGNTRERIDQVRDWGNLFTGNTGFAIAREMASLGEVDLLTSNRVHLQEAAALKTLHRIHGSSFTSHAELRDQLEALMTARRYDAVFMVAAVADYRPVRTFRVMSREPTEDGRERWVVEDVQAGKVSGSFENIAVLGERTEKLVDLFRSRWQHKGMLVKFKLEVGRSREELLAIARQSRIASGADVLVANSLDMVNGPSAGAFVVSADTEEWVARAELAHRLQEFVLAP